MLKNLLKPLYLKYRHRPIFNVYKRKFNKRVLISYISYPFRENHINRHSNYQESIAISEIFDGLGYVVDVFYQEDERLINYKKYDVIFGVGDPLENSFYCSDKNLIRIYYGLGRNVFINNNASIKRLENFYERHSKLLIKSARIGKKLWQMQTLLSDAIITLGNSVTRKSYSDFYDGKIFNLPVTLIKSFSYSNIINKRNISESKKNFLWIGGSGAIHKGLDLLIDFFSSDENSNLNLHICGPIKREADFFNFYKEKLFSKKTFIYMILLILRVKALKKYWSSVALLFSQHVQKASRVQL